MHKKLQLLLAAGYYPPTKSLWIFNYHTKFMIHKIIVPVGRSIMFLSDSIALIYDAPQVKSTGEIIIQTRI